MENKKFCKFCGEEIEKNSIVCPKCGRQLKVVKKNEEPKEAQKQVEEKGISKALAKKLVINALTYNVVVEAIEEQIDFLLEE